jgi:antitoxin component YwqK of YwqJK toxin-antitoxin module
MNYLERVNETQLEVSEDRAYLRDGRPFSGIVCIHDEHGKLVREEEHFDGVLSGVVRKFDADGRVVFEGQFKNGAEHGVCKTWNSNGDVVREETFEYGIRTSLKEWSMNELVKAWTIGPEDANYTLLQSSRKAYSSRL